MKIDITTGYDTSHIGEHNPKITASIYNDSGALMCVGVSESMVPGRYPVTVAGAVKDALTRLEHMLINTRDVAKKAGLL